MAVYTSLYTGAEIDAAIASIAGKAVAETVNAALAALEARIEALETAGDDDYSEGAKYTITVTSANEDQGTVAGGGEFDASSSILISASSKEGFEFDKWNDNNTDNPRTITVAANETYTASFKVAAPTKYTVTVASANTEQGTVSGGGEVNSGETTVITATPADGFEFEKWNDEDTTNPRTVTVTENVTYTASFKAVVAATEE